MVNEDQARPESPGTSQAPSGPAGGEPRVPVPPYDELRGAAGENTAPTAFDASNAPEPGPEPSVSDEERAGVSGTETNPEPALGVGESTRKRAEDVAPDRPDTGTEGADRPAGTADPDEEADVAGGRVT